MKVYIKNQQRLIKVNQQRIKSLLRKALHQLGLHKAELSILLVNDRRMRILNRQFRGLDRTTDVLSFPMINKKWEIRSNKLNKDKKIKKLFLTSHFSLPTSHFLLGDIVINLHQAKRQAAEHSTTLNEELGLLLIHGLLHLIGYKHGKSRYHKNKMGSKEIELRNAFRTDFKNIFLRSEV